MTITIDTNDIPQADRIWEVARVPEAIARGLTTPNAIGTYLGNKVYRQGVYYAQAAQILGLVTREANGEWSLTRYGGAFVSYDHSSKQRALRRLVLEREPMRSVITELRTSDGLSRQGLADLIQTLVPLSDSTAYRRAHTIAQWLCTLGLVTKQEGRFVYKAPTPSTVRRQQYQTV